MVEAIQSWFFVSEIQDSNGRMYLTHGFIFNYISIAAKNAVKIIIYFALLYSISFVWMLRLFWECKTAESWQIVTSHVWDLNMTGHMWCEKSMHLFGGRRWCSERCPCFWCITMTILVARSTDCNRLLNAKRSSSSSKVWPWAPTQSNSYL